MKTNTFLAATLSLFVVTSAAQAELYDPIYSGTWNYQGQWHAATAGESADRGIAARVEAQGQYNLDNSKANINNEQAYSAQLDNDTKRVNTYFANRELNRTYRQAEAGNRHPDTLADDAARYSRAMAPKRASESHIEPVFGTIYWPNVLQNDNYAAARAKLDEAFRSRDMENSGLGSKNYRDVVTMTDAMQKQLKQNINNMTPAEYVQAKNFLKTLAFEAQFTPQDRSVAVNR